MFGPYLSWRLGKFFFISQANAILPRWLVYCWMFKITFAIFRDVVWACKLWVTLIKFYYKKSVMENIYFIHKTYDQQKIDFNGIFLMFCHIFFSLRDFNNFVKHLKAFLLSYISFFKHSHGSSCLHFFKIIGNVFSLVRKFLFISIGKWCKNLSFLFKCMFN